MLTQTEYARHVTARLFDFFTVNAQWQRRLWNVGLPQALCELDEAIEGQHARALSSEAIRWLADSVKARLADDPGIGPQDRRKSLTRLLEGDLTYGGISHRVLRQYADDARRIICLGGRRRCATQTSRILRARGPRERSARDSLIRDSRNRLCAIG